MKVLKVFRLEKKAAAPIINLEIGEAVRVNPRRLFGIFEIYPAMFVIRSKVLEP